MALSALPFLKNHSLFRGLEPSDLERIASVCRVEEHPRRSLLFRTGEPGDRFFLVLSGRVRVMRTTPDGREQVLHLVGPGETFAEAALFEGGKFPADAETLEQSTLAVFPRTDLVELLRQEPDLTLRMFGNLTRRLREFVRLIEDLSLRDVPSRVAGFLLTRVRPGELTPGTIVTLPGRKADLASRLGTTPETLSRTLSKFSSDGLITSERKQVVILDPEGLRKVAVGEPDSTD
ncbi:Crp/Fnr family transcriptional regulator [candidate division KSB1 bacterium]